MYTAGRGTVQLLLVVAFVVAVACVARQPRSKAFRVYRPNKNAAKLLNHVMMYEKEWAEVLKEQIVPLSDPPYKGRDLGMPPLKPLSDNDSSVDGKKPLYDVREIVATVTEYYGAIGSFVKYGAKAVRQALACYTFKQLFYQLKNIYNLIRKKAEPNVLLQVADALKKNSASFIDILTAVPSYDMHIILSAYWESIQLLQFDGIQSLAQPNYPEVLKDNLKDVIKKIHEFLTTYCETSLAGDDFDIDLTLDLIQSTEEIVTMTMGQAVHMTRTARRLGIVTMSNHLWSSLFYHRGHPRPDSTNLSLDVSLKSEAGHSGDGSSTSGAD